jgi:hypothetical protein
MFSIRLTISELQSKLLPNPKKSQIMRFSKHLRRPFLTLWHLKFRARIRPSRLGLGLEPLEDRIVLSQFLTEPNGTLNQAFDIGMTGTDTQPTNFSAEGRLGDDGNQFESDIDYIKVVLNGGDRIGVGAAFRENTLNGIGLVNASGELVDTEYALANDPRIPFPAAQGRLNYFHWTAKTSGIYYVIINQSAAEDDYSIHIKVVPRVPLGPPGGVDEPPPAEPNDTISEAIPTDFNFLGQYYQSGLLGDNPHLAPFGNGGQDVDMYKLDISDAPMPGLLRIARVDVNLLTTSFLDGVSFPRPMPAIDELFIDFRLLNLHIFDASGNELTYDPKLSLDGSTNGENIHVQFFLPDTAATYYLGINSSGTYDPLLEGSSPGIIERAAHEIPYVFSVILGTLIVVLPDPDINLESAQVLSGNSVQFSYTTTDNPGPFEVGLYRSADGITYSPADQVGDLQVNPPSPGVISYLSTLKSSPPNFKLETHFRSHIRLRILQARFRWLCIVPTIRYLTRGMFSLARRQRTHPTSQVTLSRKLGPIRTPTIRCGATPIDRIFSWWSILLIRLANIGKPTTSWHSSLLSTGHPVSCFTMFCYKKSIFHSLFQLSR